MIVYIQKKVDGEWRTILPVSQENAHRVCYRLMAYDTRLIQFRIVKNSEAD